MKRLGWPLIAALLVMPIGSSQARNEDLPGQVASSFAEAVLWNFDPSIGDGANPNAELLTDKAGNLYGTAETGGVNQFGIVFELSPPTRGQAQWTEATLWSFGAGSDGRAPYASLIADSFGNLYGTTAFGGDHQAGTVFKLIPPSRRQKPWTETVLWSFDPADGDGANSYADLIADSSGNLYGTTESGGTNQSGTVFEVSPPSGRQRQWTEKVLWNLGAKGDGTFPRSGLLADAKGNLYGTAQGGGTNLGGVVFELVPPRRRQTQWTENLLWSFGAGTDGVSPQDRLIVDQLGNLYGTTFFGGTQSLGTAFKLSPPLRGQSQWTESVLWNFAEQSNDGAEPYAGLLPDRWGNLYGTTQFGGTNSSGAVFELSPPARGQVDWTENVLWSFGGLDDGANPVAGLIADRWGNFYGTTVNGGSNQGGAVFELALP
jgi:uncharacterized repeat protein (TIGR03803 family)